MRNCDRYRCKMNNQESRYVGDKDGRRLEKNM